jgi:hypothetical protein
VAAPTASVVTPPNTSPPAASPASAGNAATSLGAAAPAIAPVVVNWADVAQAAHRNIISGPNAGDLAGLTKTSIQLPRNVDVALLRAGAASAKRSLEEMEKRLLRAEFKKLL